MAHAALMRRCFVRGGLRARHALVNPKLAKASLRPGMGFVRPRLQYASDIHLDANKNPPKLEVAGDFLALCGDIGNPFDPAYRDFIEGVLIQGRASTSDARGTLTHMAMYRWPLRWRLMGMNPKCFVLMTYLFLPKGMSL